MNIPQDKAALAEIKVELNKNVTTSQLIIPLENGMQIVTTVPTGDDYWLFRVKLFEDQAILGFRKYNTIGIGFAQEEGSWNTNFPYTKETKQIYDHIRCNKKYDKITDEACIEAIGLIQHVAASTKGVCW